MATLAKFGFKKLDEKDLEEKNRNFKPVSLVKKLDPIVEARLRKDKDLFEKNRRLSENRKVKNKVSKSQNKSYASEKRKLQAQGIVMPKRCRRSWRPDEKKRIMDYVKALLNGNVCNSMDEAVEKTKTDLNCADLSRRCVKRWMRTKEPGKKRGVKVNEKFENAVCSKLFVTLLVEEGGTKSIEFVANAAFNNNLFRRAANEVRNLEEFKNDEQLQKLAFSNKWIVNLKRRHKLKRTRYVVILF
jgi:hypothetical protein